MIKASRIFFIVSSIIFAPISVLAQVEETYICKNGVDPQKQVKLVKDAGLFVKMEIASTSNKTFGPAYVSEERGKVRYCIYYTCLSVQDSVAKLTTPDFTFECSKL